MKLTVTFNDKDIEITLSANFHPFLHTNWQARLFNYFGDLQ